MMQIARWALGALVAALLPLTALAQGPGGAAAQAVVAGVQFPCQANQQIPLSMNFNSTGQNCKDGQTVSSYSALPGFTLASGSLSGTGATSATSYDATGKVIDFTLPTTRITNAGILVEAAATNLILDSQVMGSSPWAAFESTATDNNAVAPDGTTTAMTLVATGSFPTITSGTVTISGVQTITTSVFAQPGASSGNNQFLLKAADPNDGTFSNADAVITIIPAAGGVPGSCSAAIDSTFHYINVSATATWLPAYGYCRASLTFTTISSTTAMIQQDWVGSGATSCTGSCIGSSVNFWGAQMEIGGLTSYLPTTSAAVTRSTDTLTQTFSPGAAQYATVYFAPNQSYSYPAIPSSPLNLVSLAVTGGQPISEVLVSYTEPTPGAAIGAGYQQLTFQTPSWNGSNVDFSATCAPGHSWYFYNYGGTVPTTANTTVAGGVISVGASGNNYNSTIATVCGLGGQAWRGTAFGGGGYFEATLKWQNGAFDFTKGWPAWWMGSVEAQTLSVGTLWPGAIQTTSPGFKHFPEIDIMEYFGGDFSEPLNCATQTIIDWSGPNFSSLVLNAKDSFYCPDAIGTTFASYHKYGLLWIPATASSQGSATYYFDHLPVFQQTWTLLTAADQPPAAGNPWLFGVTDQNPAVGPNHFMLELGSGATYTSGSGNTTPIVVNDVKVWQLNINDNLYNGASPPPAPPIASGLIRPGSGFTGATTAMAAQGSSGAYGYNDDVIMAFDQPQYQTITSTFTFNVYAYHAPTPSDYSSGVLTNISYVICGMDQDNTSQWTKVSVNPARPYIFTFTVNAALSTDSTTPREVRCEAVPTTGTPIVMQGAQSYQSYVHSLYVFTNPTSTLTNRVEYISATGTDTAWTSVGSPGCGALGTPCATIMQAEANGSAANAGSAGNLLKASGVTVRPVPGDAGNYIYGKASGISTFLAADQWFNLDFTGTTAKITSRGSTSGIATSKVHIKNATIDFSGSPTSLNLDSTATNAPALWLDSVTFIGAGQAYNTTQPWNLPATRWTGGVFATDSDFSNAQNGPLAASLDRNVTVHDISSDAFQGSTAVIGGTVYNDCELKYGGAFVCDQVATAGQGTITSGSACLTNITDTSSFVVGGILNVGTALAPYWTGSTQPTIVTNTCGANAVTVSRVADGTFTSPANNLTFGTGTHPDVYQAQHSPGSGQAALNNVLLYGISAVPGPPHPSNNMWMQGFFGTTVTEPITNFAVINSTFSNAGSINFRIMQFGSAATNLNFVNLSFIGDTGWRTALGFTATDVSVINSVCSTGHILNDSAGYPTSGVTTRGGTC